jgi:hypothetical protein
MSAPRLPAGCTGDCDQGRRDCTCGRAIGMWDDEQARPGRAAALYAAAIVLALLASHFWPWGFAA